MSRTIALKGVKIGGDNHIVVQTMCNTHTQDVEKSVAQILEAVKAGSEIIRLTTQGMKEVEALAEIKRILREQGCDVPLVADVHFNADVAIAVAKVADKVRINPGNFAREHSVAQAKLKDLIQVCKEYGTVLRIGLNHGSLGERIISKYGDTPLGMKEAAMEWCRMAVEEDFHNIVLSLKASNTRIMTDAYRLLMAAMKEEGMDFPIHVGVTEAGNGDTGRIKSAVGTAALLAEGIGDTIRISLTEPPVNELPVAKIIATRFDDIRSGKTAPVDFRSIHSYSEKSWEELIVKVSCDYGPALLDRKIDDFDFEADINSEKISAEKKEFIKDEIQQAARRRFKRPEYVACPSCGRTLYNIEETFNEVKRRTSHLKGMTIAVMGCIVNGPGEMADADYGYVGEGPGKVAIYRKKVPVLRSVPQEEAIDRLLEIIENDQKQR